MGGETYNLRELEDLLPLWFLYFYSLYGENWEKSIWWINCRSLFLVSNSEMVFLTFSLLSERSYFQMIEVEVTSDGLKGNTTLEFSTNRKKFFCFKWFLRSLRTINKRSFSRKNFLNLVLRLTKKSAAVCK